MISAFNVAIKKEFDPKLVLTDNLNMTVSLKQFENVVKTFHAGSTYYLNAEFHPTNIKGATQMVTPMVRNHFRYNNITKCSFASVFGLYFDHNANRNLL